jgi:hypothetical protein
MFEFIKAQGSIDPSAFVNKLVRDEMARQPMPDLQDENYRKEVFAAMEQHLDDDTVAAD